MRITLICPQCAQQGGAGIFTLAALNDEGLHEIICAAGHKTIHVLQEQRFEVLAEVGLQAILDGYFREAVVSFAASLERFYEFYFQIICGARGLNEQQMTAAWKSVTKQSERQIGAYVAAYLL